MKAPVMAGLTMLARNLHWRPWRPAAWPWLAALAALALAAALQALWITRLQAALEQASLAEQASQQQRKLQAATLTASNQEPANPSDGLPDAQARPQRLGALLSVAARHGLQGGGVDLQLRTDHALGITELRITQSLRGRYADLRRSIGAVLQQDGAVALEQLRLSRQAVSSAEIDAECIWLMVWQTAPGARP